MSNLDSGAGGGVLPAAEAQLIAVSRSQVVVICDRGSVGLRNRSASASACSGARCPASTSITRLHRQNASALWHSTIRGSSSVAPRDFRAARRDCHDAGGREAGLITAVVGLMPQTVESGGAKPGALRR